MQSGLEAESAEFSDILQYNGTDSYRKLVDKSVAMLEWVSVFCPSARFLLKADEDMFINLPLLLEELRTMKSNHVIGNLQHGAIFDRMFCYEELALLVGGLFKLFCEERTSDAWSDEVVPGIRAWAVGDLA